MGPRKSDADKAEGRDDGLENCGGASRCVDRNTDILGLWDSESSRGSSRRDLNDRAVPPFFGALVPSSSGSRGECIVGLGSRGSCRTPLGGGGINGGGIGENELSDKLPLVSCAEPPPIVGET